MFQIVENYNNRAVVSSITLESLIDIISNPNPLRLKLIEEVREYNNDTERLRILKSSLPCVAFNFRYLNYVNKSNVLSATGYMYLDFDDIIDFDFSKFDFVSAAWKSVTGTGYGVLVKVDNLKTKDLQVAYQQVSELLGLEFDKNAVSKDRLCILSYDKNIYYNLNSTSIFIDYKKVSLSLYTSLYLNCFQPNDTFFNGRISFSNYEFLVSNIDFKGEAFKDFGEARFFYTKVFLPKEIGEGNRNSQVYNLASKVYFINRGMKLEDVKDFCHFLNNSRCSPPMSRHEVNDIARSVFENSDFSNFKPNASSRIVFNPKFNLSPEERRLISQKIIAESRSNNTQELLWSAVDNWNFENNGKITAEKLAFKLDLGIATVKRYYPNIKNIVKNRNKS